MNRIQQIQQRVGTTPDGFWGPKSQVACQKHLRSMMPNPNHWPSSNQSALKSFYGDPSKSEVAPRLTRINVADLDVEFSGAKVREISVHSRCADSLLRVLRKIAASPFAHLLQQYAGVYNHRPMRGGTNWSLHAYGAAIDIAPGSNGLHTHWPTGALMPIEVMEFFAEEGWVNLGWLISRDAMHFQATR